MFYFIKKIFEFCLLFFFSNELEEEKEEKM